MTPRRAVVAVAVTVIVAGAAVGGVLVGRRSVTRPAGQTTAPPATATVVRTDLSTTQQVTGSLGHEHSWTVTRPSGTSAAVTGAARTALSTAYATLLSDQTAADDAAALAAHQVAAASAALSSASLASAAQRTQLRAALTTAELGETASKHDHDAKVAADQATVSNAQETLTAVEETTLDSGATFTALPAAGDVIRSGGVVYQVDGHPVPLLYGAIPQFRAWRAGEADGADVGELTANLIALGYADGLPQSNHFSEATAAAIQQLQRSLGLEPTGTLLLGSVVVLPDAIRVASVHSLDGSAVAPGAVLEATSTTPIVTVQVPVTKQQLIHDGDTVSIVLPDGSSAPAAVTTVAKVATCPQGDNSNTTPSGATGACGSSTPVVAVTITLADPSVAAGLDQAPVSAVVTDKSAKGVLAVPINALLATASGGDAVELVAADGSHRLVAVTTGLFAKTLVEVSGDGIVEGASVEVPPS